MSGHTEAELVEALGHVGYEVWMMTQAAARLRADDSDEIATNAYIESMLLHARSLADFLVVVKDRQYATDIKRTDFAREWLPEPVETVKTVLDEYPRLHKYLAHLTWDRVGTTKPSWTYWTIASDLVSIADRWSALLAGAPVLFKAFRPYVKWSLDLLGKTELSEPGGPAIVE